jgi:cyclase
MRSFVVGCLGVLLASGSLYGQAGTAAVKKTNLARDTYLFSAPEGNLVLYDGPNGFVAAGVQSPSLVRAARAQVDARTGRRGYAIALVSDSAAAYGDGGWASAGAVTIAHENLRRRLAQQTGTRSPSSPVTSLGFSEVIQIYVPGEDTHAVHQKPGYSDADVSVHLERAGVLILGSIFTADGYPAIDTEHGGNFAGLLETATTFANNFGTLPTVVPARGPAASGKVLRDYVAMLTTVRNRVQQLSRAGQSLDQVIAARPSAEFDARWGHGSVSPAAFITQVYNSLHPR